MGSDVKIARALISVTDKTGVVDFARTLVDDFGVEIISTGGRGHSRTPHRGVHGLSRDDGRPR